MNHIGLFEGIGGFSLAARWMGWKTIAWCEIDPFCQAVLTKNFPDAKGHSDIIQTDFSIYRGQCDILTGGFPCQGFSLAGKRKGREDERYLWPYMLEAIRQAAPRYVVAENVGGLLTQENGLAFEQVCSDLEAEGYEVQTFVIPACAVNAPHRRDRVWIIGYAAGVVTNPCCIGHQHGPTREYQYGERAVYKNKSDHGNKVWIEAHRYSRLVADTDSLRINGKHGDNRKKRRRSGEPDRRRESSVISNPNSGSAGQDRDSISINGKGRSPVQAQKQGGISAAVFYKGRFDISWNVSDALGVGIQRHRPVGKQEPGSYAGEGLPGSNHPGNYWKEWPTEPPLHWRNDGLPKGMVRFTDGSVSRFNEAQTQGRNRNEAIKAYGNAIVPQIAFEIFKAINQMYETK